MNGVTSAILLAAGRGTRLRPMTDRTPKPMVEVGGEPLLARMVRELTAHGVRDLVFVVGHLGHVIREHFGDGRSHGAVFRYREQQELNGTAGALRLAERLVAGSFLTIFADSFFAAGSIAAVRESAWPNAIGVTRVSDPRKYGVVQTDDRSRVIGVVEKPTEFIGNLIVSGIYKFDPAVWAYLSQVPASPRGELELPDVVRAMIADDHAIGAVELPGFHDIASLEDLERVRKLADAERASAVP